MTENPYQSPREPGADVSPRRSLRRLRTFVGILLFLGGFYVCEFGHLMIIWSRSYQDSILLKVGAVLGNLIGIGMVLFACLMAVGLVWRTHTRTRYDRGPPTGT